MHVIASLNEVRVGGYGDVVFGLYLSNKGTSP
jgi:hypothetical protein